MKNQQHKIQIFFGILIIAAVAVWLSVYHQNQADTPNILKIYYLNVGQGDSEYIKLPNGKDILIDGGPDDRVLTELGKVMNFNDKEISLMVLTHPHADHIAGLVSVMERYKIGEIWWSDVSYPSNVYDAFKEKIKQNNIDNKIVSAGTEEDFDNIKFKVLYPLTSLENKKIDNLNNASIITELDDDNFKALFLGDAEQDSQKQIINKLSKMTVVKVAHHGSTNGALDDLYKIARPTIAVIEVGAKNNYGHPAQSVINLLKKYLVQIYRTDQNGTIEIDFDGKNYQVKTAD
jgi:competence protein ComEC